MEPTPVSTDALIEVLLDTNVVTEDALDRLLGPERHDLRISTLESALLNGNVLSPRRLLLLKGSVSGRDVLEDDNPVPTTAIPERTASAAGAVALETPAGAPLSVAMVEDQPENLEAVAAALNGEPFNVVLCTTQQLQSLFLAAYRPNSPVDGRPLAQHSAKDIYELLDIVLDRDATDLHLRVGAPPFIRVDGSLTPIPRRPLDNEWLRTEVAKLLDDAGHKQLTESFGTDIGFSFGNVRFRANIGYDSSGLTVAARTLPSQVPTMAQLGLPSPVQELTKEERGLVLVTGPTGSGKTTTLAAMLQHILSTSRRHVITLEDPIEYFLRDGQGAVSQRELGRSLTTYAEGLRQALRQDPDVILVGEMRDLDTMRTALNAAETGHLVFSTMHTYDAASTLNRMISAFNPVEQDHVRSQLAYLLRGVVSQALLPRIDRSGRIAAFEVLLGIPRVRNSLRTPKGLQNVRQMLTTGSADGMQTLEQNLAQLVREGIVSVDEAEFRARDVEEFRKRRNS